MVSFYPMEMTYKRISLITGWVNWRMKMIILRYWMETYSLVFK